MATKKHKYGSFDKRTTKKHEFRGLNVEDGIDDGYIDIDSNINNPSEKLTIKQIKNCNEFCKWIWHKPLKKLAFLYFFLSIFICSICAFYYILGEHVNSYIISGIYFFILSLFGFNHFRSFFVLKNEICDFRQKNIKFKKEIFRIKNCSKKIKSANKELKQTIKRLKISNKNMKINVYKLKHLENNMKITDISSLKQVKNVKKMANSISKRVYNNLLQQEKNTLMRIFDRFCAFETGNYHCGIYKNDYNKFIKLLPNHYQKRFRRLKTFKILSGNKNYINFKDFQISLSIYARMNVENVDISFKIHRNLMNDKRKIFIIERTAPKKGDYLSYRQLLNDIDSDNGDNDDGKDNNHNHNVKPLLFR